MKRIHIIDSHTGGEPTRLVMDGAPDLGVGPIQERLNVLKYRHDDFRRSVINEPRGNDVLVGALLLEPHDPSCTAGVIFFNNVGYLGMCGHGTIGLMATLAYLGKVTPGPHRIETPVGIVTAHLHEDGKVSVANVPSYRFRKQVEVNVPGHGLLHGDVAWGGNWFFLIHNHGQALALNNIEALTDFCWRVRESLGRNGITGKDGGEIDHIELYGESKIANSQCFVLCPGKAYDRSPCGTGTSAKLACLVADGLLREGDVWRQESIVGSVFEGSVRIEGGVVYPTITGEAFVTGEATLIFDERDPFVRGITS
jgi:4-hydroxyproline epimerase